jgi:type VI protein secretion system component Hcp
MKSRLSFAFVLLFSIPAFGAYDAFMKFGNVNGNAIDPAHKGWIEVTSFSFGVTQHGAGSATTHGSASPAQQVIVRVKQGPYLAQLQQMGATGQHAQSVIIDNANQRYTLQDVVVVSSTLSSMHGGEMPEATLTLAYSHYTMAITPKVNSTPLSKLPPATTTAVVPPHE